MTANQAQFSSFWGEMPKAERGKKNPASFTETGLSFICVCVIVYWFIGSLVHWCYIQTYPTL